MSECQKLKNRQIARTSPLRFGVVDLLLDLERCVCMCVCVSMCFNDCLCREDQKHSFTQFFNHGKPLQIQVSLQRHPKQTFRAMARLQVKCKIETKKIPRPVITHAVNFSISAPAAEETG